MPSLFKTTKYPKVPYTKEFDRIDEAYYRERQIHGWNHAKKLALIEGRNVDLPGLAKSYWRKRKQK